VASGCSEEDSDLSGSDNGDATWVSWFCSLKGNEFFVEVEEDFIQDDFNLTGLSTQVRAAALSSKLYAGRCRGCACIGAAAGARRARLALI
jgi:hypothetical protein